MRIPAVVLCAVLLAFAAVSPASAGDPSDAAATLEMLGRGIASFQTLKTSFVQEKHLALFQSTIVLKGRIVLQKPGRVAWHVDSPVRSSVVIDGGTVRQWDEDSGRVQEISLAKNPLLQNVLGQLTGWFSGSYGAFLKDFDVELLKSAPYVFRFLPRKTHPAAAFLRSIEIEFRDDHRYLRRLTVVEQGGDRSDLTFLDTQFDVPLAPRDLEVKQRV